MLSKINVYLFHTTKELLTTNIRSFFSLAAVNALIMLVVVLLNQWFEQQYDIFQFNFQTIVFRLVLFLFFLGLWIGFFKQVFNFIDHKPIILKDIFKYFYLIPQILAVRILSYLSTTPFIAYYLWRFPYNINHYGANINEYFYNTIMSAEPTTLYTSDLLIFTVLSILPIVFLLRFWCIELLLIDKHNTIFNSIIKSYKMSAKIYPVIVLAVFMFIFNLLVMFLGFIFFIFSITISYIVFFLYYRLLLLKK